MKKFLALIVLGICFGCNSDDDTQNPILCTEELRPGLEVTVTDGLGGAILTEGVTVIAVDNDYSETLENFEGTNTFIGAFERTGSYIITVNKNGYEEKTLGEPVIVEADVCHVITESVEVILQKK